MLGPRGTVAWGSQMSEELTLIIDHDNWFQDTMLAEILMLS